MTARRVGIIGMGIVLAVGVAAGSVLQAKKGETEDAVYHELELFTDALSIIQADYVEQPEAKSLVYGALKMDVFAANSRIASVEERLERIERTNCAILAAVKPGNLSADCGANGGGP